MATIYEVATRAGVSPATVSRVFNGISVSPEKVKRVKKAAAELNFTPNRTARSLRRRNSEVIALILPDIENPYFTSMARGVEDVAQQAGYSIVLCNSDENPEKEATYLQIAVSENMAGVIVAPASEQIDLQALLKQGRPVVAVDRSAHSDIDLITMNNREAGSLAAQSLRDAGYTRIACITGPEEIQTAEERSMGWRSVIEPMGTLEDIDSYLRYSTFRVDGGREAMRDLLRMRPVPDALVAANNLMGVGALQELAESRLTPPGFGVAVIGDLPFTTLAPRAVTIVQLPVRHMGTMAAQMLIERINGDTQPARTVVLRNRLVPAQKRFEDETVTEPTA